jgi:hypothetical protein
MAIAPTISQACPLSARQRMYFLIHPPNLLVEFQLPWPASPTMEQLTVNAHRVLVIPYEGTAVRAPLFATRPFHCTLGNFNKHSLRSYKR